MTKGLDLDLILTKLRALDELELDGQMDEQRLWLLELPTEPKKQNNALVWLDNKCVHDKMSFLSFPPDSPRLRDITCYIFHQMENIFSVIILDLLRDNITGANTSGSLPIWEKNIFLALLGAQGVAMSVCLAQACL